MSPTSRPTARRLAAVLSLVPAATLATCERSTEVPAPAEILVRLAESGLPRVIGPRLSVATEYRECALQSPGRGTITVTVCPADTAKALPPAWILSLSSAASEDAPATADPDTLHAIAIADLLWPDTRGISLDRSISFLQKAVRLSDRPAPVLADLAAAHLVRAERKQSPRDLLEALEAAVQALELEADHPAALFNLALALDRLTLDGEAATAWGRFLARERDSDWSGDAETRIRALREVPAARPALGARATPAEVAAFVSRSPQQARLMGWEELLGDWGEAVMADDAARAEERLRLAEMLGRALERQGGDATLADAVRAIQTHGSDPAVTQLLAQAHRGYAEGRRDYLAANTAGATRRFESVRAADIPPGALQQWATMSLAAIWALGNRLGEAEETFLELLAMVDTLRHPALAGSVRLGLATTLLRDSRSERALHSYRQASHFFARAKEHENVGATYCLTADAEFALHARAAGYASMHHALTALRRQRASVWLHNLLSVGAEAAAADGLGRAALRIQSEGVAVAERSGRAPQIAEAYLWRAQFQAPGDTARAGADLRRAAEVLERLPAGNPRSFLATELRLARAGLLVRSRPARAAHAMDTVLLRSPDATGLQRLRARVRRAEARFALGDVHGATGDLDRASEAFREQMDHIERTPFRASLTDAARNVFDRLVLLQLARGDTLAALHYLERGRASLRPRGEERRTGSAQRWQAPGGSVAVEYALIGDTLLTWTVADTVVRLSRAIQARAELVELIEKTRASLEVKEEAEVLRPLLAELYDRLVRPVRERLGPEGTPIVVVADGEIAAVPFAALYDTSRARYLVEGREVRFLGSLRDAADPGGSGGLARLRALFVTSPTQGGAEHGSFRPLPGALEEVEASAPDYAATVLTGPAADEAGVESALQRVDVVHFATHAVFDDDRPERSFLLLSPGGRRAGDGRLTAAEVERMRLRHVRLVVLSACETLPSRAGRSGGFAGFADALLAAGAEGVVGSLWRVDDDATAALMTEFHRAYRDDRHGPRALRAAQLHLLQSANPRLRSPTAWAGFRYAGN